MKEQKKLAMPFIEYSHIVVKVPDRFNSSDTELNRIISEYFYPKNHKEHFARVLLNTSIISFGQKIKLVANFEKFDTSWLKSLHALNKIRNGFAHSNSYPVFTLETRGVNKPIKAEHANKIDIMNSNGIIKSEDFDEQLQIFKDLFIELTSTLKAYRKKLAVN